MEAAHFRKELAHTGLTILDRFSAEKEKEYTESHKIDELYEFSNDSSLKCFERSTVERIEENLGGYERLDIDRCIIRTIM